MAEPPPDGDGSVIPAKAGICPFSVNESGFAISHPRESGDLPLVCNQFLACLAPSPRKRSPITLPNLLSPQPAAAVTAPALQLGPQQARRQTAQNIAQHGLVPQGHGRKGALRVGSRMRGGNVQQAGEIIPGFAAQGGQHAGQPRGRDLFRIAVNGGCFKHGRVLRYFQTANTGKLRPLPGVHSRSASGGRISPCGVLY